MHLSFASRLNAKVSRHYPVEEKQTARLDRRISDDHPEQTEFVSYRLVTLKRIADLTHEQ